MAMTVEDRWLSAVNTLQDWAREYTPWTLTCTSRRSGGCFLQMTWQLTPQEGKSLWPGGPARAAILVCSGPVTEQQGQNLVAQFAKLGDTRHVIVLGTRVLPQAKYALCPEIALHIADLLPVDLIVLGYPPKPEGVTIGIQHLLSSWLIRKQLPTGKHLDEELPAEVVYRQMARHGAPPTREEMERDRTLADRPPV